MIHINNLLRREHTSILDTILLKHTMTPITNAPNNLHTTRPSRHWWIPLPVDIVVILLQPAPEIVAKALLKFVSDLVQLFAVRVACRLQSELALLRWRCMCEVEETHAV